MRGRLLLRQATSSLGASVVLVLIVALSAAVFTAWPRLQSATYIDEINYQIAQTPPTSRAITAQHDDWPVLPGTRSWADLDADLAQNLAHAGPSLRAAAGTTRWSVTTAYSPVTPQGGLPPDLVGATLGLRVDPRIEEHVEIVDGAAPAPSPVDAELADVTTQEEWEAFLASEWQPTDVMLSEDSAERLGVGIGDLLTVGPPGADVPARVSGTFRARDPDADQWQFQLNTIRPLLHDDPNAGLSVDVTAYIHPDTVQWLTTSGLGSASTRIWIPVTPTTDDTEGLISDLRDFTARDQEVAAEPGGAVVTTLTFRSGLTDVLDRALARWQGTAAVLTMVAAGPAGVTFAIVALAVRLAVTRRRATLALASARGGSPAQVRGVLALEGLVLGLPAAAAGAALGTLVPTTQGDVSDYLLPAAVGLSPALFLATASLPSLRAARPDLSTRSTSRWRWVVEVVVLALAAAGVYLLLERGVVADADPVAVTVPLLLALAACVLALRVFPWPLRLAHGWLRRTRGLSGFLGSARAIREGTAGVVPMLALIVGIAIAVFSTSMLTTVQGGADAGARSGVGADLRVSGPAVDADLAAQVRGIDGVAQLAAITSVPNTPLYEDAAFRRLTLYAVDSEALRAVQADVPGAVQVPAGMSGLSDGAVPVLVSAGHEVAEGELRLVVGDDLPVRLVGEPEGAAGIADGSSWALADLDLLRETTGQNLASRLLLVDLTDGADPAAVTGALRDLLGDTAVITTPGEDVDEFLSSPSASSMQRGFALALVMSTLLSIVAIVITLVLAAPARGLLMAVLRTLGAGPGLARRLVAWETAPLALVAFVVGTALGLALPHVVAAAVDLRPFTGADTAPAVQYDPLLLLAVLAAVALVLGACVLLASTIARRLSLSVLRIGEAS